VHTPKLFYSGHPEKNIVVSDCRQTRFWGVFALAAAVGGRAPWHERYPFPACLTEFDLNSDFTIGRLSI